MSDNLKYHRQLQQITRDDVSFVEDKDTQYDASWKRHGGVGAFFTIVRPWDRLYNYAKQRGFDLFEMIGEEGLEGPDGSVIACVRDMRRYLLLVEAHMAEELGVVPIDSSERDVSAAKHSVGPPKVVMSEYRPGTPEDGGHHEGMFSPPFIVGWPTYLDPGNGAVRDVLWERRSNDVFQIVPRISVDTWVRCAPSIQMRYSPVWRGERPDQPDTFDDRPFTDHENDAPTSYWLRVEEIPEHVRNNFRILQEEQNLKEAEDLMEYVELYRWSESNTRYLIRDLQRAWTRGGE